jgi:hypothetical protein
MEARRQKTRMAEGGAGTLVPAGMAATNRMFAILAIVVILLAAGAIAASMAIGGNVFLIVLGLLLAATSMELFRLAHDGAGR